MSEEQMDRNHIRARIHLFDAGMNYHLECFGDKLAKEQGYKDIDGIAAIHHYLTIKHNWLPSQVKDLSLTVIRELLNEEYQSHKPSDQEKDAYKEILADQANGL